MRFHDHFDLATSAHNSMAPVAIAMEYIIIFMSFSLQQPCEWRRYCLHVRDMAGGVLILLFYHPVEEVHSFPQLGLWQGRSQTPAPHPSVSLLRKAE